MAIVGRRSDPIEDPKNDGRRRIKEPTERE
jgi:hypothetical protein